MTFLNELEWRSMIYDKTEGVEELFTGSDPVSAYIGFDPTASSLHAGNLLPIMGLVHWQRAGNIPIALVGGATGMIGDPSGKSKERNLLTPELLQHNVDCIHKQLARFLDFDAKKNPAKLVNNADWTANITFIDFMRDIGKHFSVNQMLTKDSVKRRIGGDGISFTEFSYSILQSYDFYHLNKTHGCRLQMGGSDQWGNITSGTDFCRRMGASSAHGIVFPLLTTSSGAKFGKSESGAVWLDPEQTSPYRFYQYWVNAEDADALKYLKIFSTLTQEECAELQKLQEEAPHKRDVQKRLAAEVTRTVHGQDGLDRAMAATQAMFGGQLTQMSADEISEIFEEVPSTEIPISEFQGEGYPILSLFTKCGATKSNGEARNMLQGGGLNINNVQINDMKHMVTINDAIEGRFIVLRKGKKKYSLVKVMA